MDKSRINKKIALLIIIFLSLFFIVSLFLLFLSNRQHLSIVNDNNIESVYFQNNKSKIVDRIWNIVKQKDNLSSIFTSISDITIRDDSYQEDYENDHYDISFIIDSNSLKQTYQIYILATEKEIEEVKVNCVKNDITKYPQTPCTDESGSNQDISFNLPHYDYLKDNKEYYIEQDKYDASRLIIRIPSACGDESLIEEAKEKTTNWIKNQLYLNPDNYELEVITTLCYNVGEE